MYNSEDYFNEKYRDYKLHYAIEYIESSISKEMLRDAVLGLNFFDVVEHQDIQDAFNKKAKELGLDEDKLYEWCNA